MESFKSDIHGQIDKIPEGRIFTFGDLAFPLAKLSNVAVILSNTSSPAPLPTDEASRQTVWPTQGDCEMATTRESDSTDRGPDNTDQSFGNTDSLLAIPDLSPVGDAAGSMFSIFTPDPGGQTDNRYVRRIKPPKKKRGRSV